MDGFEDKYALTNKESIFLAKKRWDENVYCGMRMENRAVTFPQTKTILDGVNVPGVTLNDVCAILNMRDAWRYLLDTIDSDLTLEYMCALNGFVARNEALQWGVLRGGAVGISGTDYTPPLPSEDSVKNALKAILDSRVSITKKAIEIFLWGMRAQLFWDGNKRTSLLCANKLLISHGCGMLTITDKHIEAFNTLLINYYNTADDKDLMRFLYDNALFGIEK